MPLRNWHVIISPAGGVAPGLPIDDLTYYDDGTGQYRDNVRGTERCASLARLDANFGELIMTVDTARCPAAFLLSEGSRSVNTSAAVGNASLMMTG